MSHQEIHEETVRRGRLFRFLTFFVAVVALIVALIAYFRVYGSVSYDQTQIADGAVSLSKLDKSLASQLEDAIAYYESAAGVRDGADGQDGMSGSHGSTGSTGADGSQGYEGADGAQGASGNAGTQGAQGPRGASGAQGTQGEKGDAGERGATGSSGVLSTVLGDGLVGDVADQVLTISLVTRANINNPGGLEIGSNGITLTSACSNGQILKYTYGEWACANDDVGSVTTADLVSATPGVSVTGGVGAVLGGGASISIATATSTQNGLLSSADWNTFNNKSGALSFIGNGLFARTGDTVAVTTCTASQILVFNGTNWVCATNSDADTTYSAGPGLALDGTVLSLNTDLLTRATNLGNNDDFIVSTAAGTQVISYNDLFGDLLGGLNYRGTWNASTNQPDLTGVCNLGTKGHYYVVSVEGAHVLDGVSDWNDGDWVVCNESAFEKIETTNKVTSVHGRTGAIAAEAGDYSAAQITNVASGGVTATTVQGAITQLEAQKLNTALASGHIWLGNGSNLAEAVVLSGDATLSNSGILTINNGAITGDKIASGVIGASHLAEGAITATNIANGSITLDKLASNDCIEGQILRFTGGAWTCSDEAAGTQIATTGSGAPEGVKNGNVGEIYTDSATGDVYVKRTGNGTSTGWERVDNASNLPVTSTNNGWRVREYPDRTEYYASRISTVTMTTAPRYYILNTDVAYPSGITAQSADERLTSIYSNISTVDVRFAGLSEPTVKLSVYNHSAGNASVTIPWSIKLIRYK